MTSCDLNKLAMDIFGRLLSQQQPQVPLSYGDPKLQELLLLIEYASIKRFQFLDGNGRPSKRNLVEWLKSRSLGRRFNHEKLCGFAEFAAAMSWRGDFADLAHQLLDHPKTQESIHISTFHGQKHVEYLRSIVTRNPYLQNEQGQIPVNRKYGVISWHHDIEVDSEGNGVHKFNARICNLLDDELSLLTPPIFVDRPCPVESLRPWAKVYDDANLSLTAKIDGWNGSTGAVFLELSPPIEPFEAATIAWGYETPLLFAPGDEYYRFDINNPTAHRVSTLRFSTSWRVSNIRTLSGRKLFDSRGNTVKWEHFFPRIDLYETRFKLARV